MKDLEKKVLDKIDDLKDEIVKFHQDFIKIPSINPPGKYKEVSEFIENKMKKMGLKTLVKKKNVVGVNEKSMGPSLIIYGHMDTIPAFEGWNVEPFGGKVIDGKIFGRGACDDKACVTAGIFAAEALLKSKVNFKGKLTLASVVDEETLGYRGARYLVDKGLVDGDACLLGDGRGEYAGAYHGGIIVGTVVTKGKNAHSLGAPDIPKYRNEASGINAIQKMIPFLNFFTELQEEFLKKETKYPISPDHPVKVGVVSLPKIQGGEKMSGIPEKCMLYFTISTIPEQPVEEIKRKILDFVEVRKKNDPFLNVNVNFTFSYEPYISNTNGKLAKSVAKALRTVYKEKRDFIYLTGANDGHYFNEKGIDVIMIGSGTDKNKVHAADEFIKVEELIETTKIFALTMLNFLKQ